MTATLLALVALVCLAAGGILLVVRRATRVRIGQAREWEKRGQRRRSIAVLRDVLESNPGDGSARWMLANLLADSGDASDTWTTLEPLVADGGDGRLEERPGWPAEVRALDVLTLAARCLVKRNEGSAARRLLAQHAARWTGVEAAGETTAQGTISSETGRGGDAVEAAAFLKLRAEVAEAAGEPTEALEAWRALEAMRGLDAEECLHAGRLLLRFHKPEDAIRLLERARDARPDADEVLPLLAEALTAAGRHVDAHRIWRRLYLDAKGRARVSFGFKLAASLEDVGNPKGAVEALEQVAALEECRADEKAEALVQAGDLWARMERPEEAAKRWTAALESVPDHAGACRRLGKDPRPDSAPALVRYVRSLPPPAFRKMFERILTDWGYTLASVREVDRDTLRFVVTRLEGGKERRKLVVVARWENEVGQFPVQDLKLEVLEEKYDAGVFITMGRYSGSALVFAGRTGVLELFSAAELLPLIEHIELPR